MSITDKNPSKSVLAISESLSSEINNLKGKLLSNSVNQGQNPEQEEEEVNNNSNSDPELNVETLNVKIVFVGDSNVGKTSIIRRYFENIFDESNILSTISVAYKNKKIKIDPFTEVNMNIWDTAGQEKYRSMTRGYLRGSHGVFLVFDFSTKKSFESIISWLSEINNSDVNKKCVKILIGNKDDCEQKEVDFDEAKKFADDNDIQFFNVSAKTGINIETMFEMMGTACAKIMQEENEENIGDASKNEKNKSSKLIKDDFKKDIEKEEKKYSCC